MPTYTQYRNTSGGYSTPTAAIVQSALNDAVPVRDDYLAFNNGQNSTVVIVGDYQDGKFEDATVITVDRSASSNYTVTTQEFSEVSYSVGNPYYTYSSIGMGQFMEYPRTGYYTSLSVMICCVFCVLSVLLRNLFPRWGKR